MLSKLAWWISVLLIYFKTSVFSLNAPATCFKCDHVTDPATCTFTTMCNSGEVCAVRKYQGPNGQYQSTGCINETKCTAADRLLSSSQLVGRREESVMAAEVNKDKRQTDTLVCEKCCFGDKCNVLNCTTTATSPVCVDKVSQCSNQLYRDVICRDDKTAVAFCQKSCGKCPVDGGFSSWMPWSDCSVSCGGQGDSIRVRTCNSPKPQYNGRPCQGQTMELKSCDNGHCPVDGNWSPWGQWLPCNTTCGGGTTMRVRSCSDPVPRYGGKPCANPASFVETQQCNTHPCPVDGNWSPWGQWLPCNVTCGGGTSMRIRSCSNPVPRYGGQPCANPASFVQTTQCNTHFCPTTSPVPISKSTLHTTTPVLATTQSCQDQALCSDPHMKQIACKDLYLANTFCPKMCSMCGPTASLAPCSDLAGKKCNEHLFQYFACTDPDLVGLCRLTCGTCHT